MERVQSPSVKKDSHDEFEEKVEGTTSEIKDSLGLLTEAEVLKMQFDAEKDAHTFYNLYARVTGFSIRKDRIKVSGDNVVMSRKWVCSRQGVRASKYNNSATRMRRPRAETRVGCEAVFRVRYDREIGKYVVTHFVQEHNHPLASSHCVPFLWSHRSVTNADKAQATAMRGVGIKTGQIMDIMANQCGGPANVGFIRKDLHNFLQAERRVQLRDGDAEGALGYFFSKATEDPLFFYKYDVDEENRLDKLLWADSKSRMDYAAFGDVLAFDTTYRTNAYKKPFVIFAGVNNHYMTTIFGCALLANETVETYTWVLEALMEAMGGKRPISVVTDGDKAMHQAIGNVFPGCNHRLCMWHLERNAATNVHIPEFQEDFKRLSRMDCERDEFDKAWVEVLDKHGIANNNWVVDAYRIRHKWADSYLRGQLFVGMRSTQRCEGMNAYFNEFLRPGLRLYEFVGHFDRGLSRMRFKEAEADAVTENSVPVPQTKLRSIEKHGAQLFTRRVFSFFRDEIEREGALVLDKKIDNYDHRIYYVGKYLSKSTWRLEYYPSGGIIKCSCMKHESFGIPCCHMISVMKCEQLSSIPLHCFLPRWARCARPEPQQSSLPTISKTLTQTARYAMLSLSYNQMAFYASHLDPEFDEARELAIRMTCQMKRRWEMLNEADDNSGEMENGGTKDGIASKLFGVQDPKVVKTKGNPGGSSKTDPSKARKCGYCRGVGHTRRTCKKWLMHNQKKDSEDDTKEATNAEFISSYQDDYHHSDGGELGNGGNNEGVEQNMASKVVGAEDSYVAKPRKCGHCRSIGHTKRTCKKWLTRFQKEGSEDDIEENPGAGFISSFEDDNQ